MKRFALKKLVDETPYYFVCCCKCDDKLGPAKFKLNKELRKATYFKEKDIPLFFLSWCEDFPNENWVVEVKGEIKEGRDYHKPTLYDRLWNRFIGRRKARKIMKKALSQTKINSEIFYKKYDLWNILFKKVRKEE